MASEFAERLESLQQDIAKYRTDINSQISAIYSPTPTAGKVDLKNDPRYAIQMLQTEVAELLRESKQYSSDLVNNNSQLKECETMVSVLAIISNASEKIIAAEEKVSTSDVLGGVQAVSRMGDAVKALPSESSEVGNGAVCRTLRQEAAVITSRFHTRLRRLFLQCVTVERGHVLVLKELKDVVRDEGTLLDSPVSLKDTIAALIAVGRAVDVLTEVTTRIWLDVIAPLWKERKLLSPRVYSATDSDKAELLFESISKESGPSNADVFGPCKMPFSSLMDHISQILSFTFTEVLCADAEAVRISANCIRDSSKIRLAEALNSTLVSLMPKSENELAHFTKSVEKSCSDFETKMGNLGWIPACDGGRGFLSTTVAHLNDKFVEIRRRDILARARELVLSDYHNTMLGTGDAQEDEPSSAGDVGDPKAILDNSGSFNMQALRFESCQVSLAACRLLKLIHEVMKQASQSPPLVAETLYHSARDCLELFIAVVPSKFSSVIETVPRMGAVFYNDCVYISHNCTLMTHLYRQEMRRVDASLKDIVGFIDYIPRLRSLGEECLCVHLEDQKGALIELLARVNLSMNHENSNEDEGLRLEGLGVDSRDARNDVSAAGALVKHMERLRGQWYNVLQDTVYSRLASHLVETVVRTAMKPVLECDYISEKSGADVSRVFRTLHKLRSAFPEDMQTDTDVLRLVVSWDKFVALTDLLEFSLSDIAEALPKRKFSSFTGAEMASLVRALFEDSYRRQAILTSIMDMAAVS